MQYINFTYIDSVTGISIQTIPATNNTVFPKISELVFEWAKTSEYPTPVPKFFGTCPDDSNTAVEGVIKTLTKEEYEDLKLKEINNTYLCPKTITAKQLRLQLLNDSLLDSVKLLVNIMPITLQIEWEYSTEIDRKSELIKFIGTNLDLSEQKLDEIYIEGNDIL